MLPFDILGAILAPRETLGCHFGISGAPWAVILAPQEHLGGTWEQQDGLEVVNNRIFVDLGMILSGFQNI